MLEKLPHGLPLHHSGIDGTHLQRFHKDPQEPLTAYGVFHGDDRLPFGEPVPTGSLRRSTRTLPSLTLTHTQNASPSGPGVYHTFSGGPPKDAYTIRPTMSLQSLLKDDGSSAASPTRTLGGTLGKTSTSMTYQYATGTFTSTSGLPPTQYKSWTSEYGDEYRGPKERKEIREQLTMRHGTADALKTGRYQFQGYPYDASNPAFRTYVPSSLTERGQVMPNYESRLKSF